MTDLQVLEAIREGADKARADHAGSVLAGVELVYTRGDAATAGYEPPAILGESAIPPDPVFWRVAQVWPEAGEVHDRARGFRAEGYRLFVAGVVAEDKSASRPRAELAERRRRRESSGRGVRRGS